MEPYQICMKHMKERIEKKHICNLVCINMFEMISILIITTYIPLYVYLRLIYVKDQTILLIFNTYH